MSNSVNKAPVHFVANQPITNKHLLGEPTNEEFERQITLAGPRGSSVMKTACHEAFVRWNDLDAIYGFVLDSNQRAQRFFLKSGFHASDDRTLSGHKTFKLLRADISGNAEAS